MRPVFQSSAQRLFSPAMFKMRHANPGSAPATLLPFAPGEAAEPVFTLIEYNPEHFDNRQIASVAELPEADENWVRWIDMSGLGNLEVLKALGEKYNLHPLALEDVLNTAQRPKTEPYEQHLFIVGQMLYNDEDGRLCTEQVSFFLRSNLLITIQEEAQKDVFTPVRERLRSGSGFIRKQKADYLAYALLDAIIDHCFPALEELGESVEDLEDELLNNPTAECVRTLHEYRRKLMIFRRFVWPEREVISGLLHDESGLIASQTKVYLRDCYDHTIQIMDLIESYREVTSGLLDMYLSCVSMRTNEIMRLLTVITSIFIPLTFIAGVYGMNFDFDGGKMPWNMPELHKPWGYIACIAVMLAIAIAQVVFFRRKKWL